MSCSCHTTLTVPKLARLTLTPEIQSSIDAIYNQIVTLVKSQGKSFGISDIYNLISAATVAVNSFFAGTSTSTKVTYAAEIVQQVIADLSKDDIIPSEVGFIIKFIPVQMIVEFVFKFIDKPVAMPSGSPQEVLKKLSVKNHTGLKQ